MRRARTAVALLVAAAAAATAGPALAAARAPAPERVWITEIRPISARQGNLVLNWTPVINADTGAPYTQYILRARPGCTYFPVDGDMIEQSSAGPVITTAVYTVHVTCNVGNIRLAVRAADRQSKVRYSDSVYVPPLR